MFYPYYVAVDGQGQAAAVTKRRRRLARLAAARGAEIVVVRAANAFLAKQHALAVWLERRRNTRH